MNKATEAYQDYVDHLREQVQFCVDFMDVKGLLEDGEFTFPDGETVQAQRKKPSNQED